MIDFDGEAGVDAGSVAFGPLQVEPTQRITHPLRAHRDHADAVGELITDGCEVTDQEAV